LKERALNNLQLVNLGGFVAIPCDANPFFESEEIMGFRAWNAWFRVHNFKSLRETAKSGDSSNRIFSGVQGKVWYGEPLKNLTNCIDQEWNNSIFSKNYSSTIFKCPHNKLSAIFYSIHNVCLELFLFS
jgi:hypothetical protein